MTKSTYLLFAAGLLAAVVGNINDSANAKDFNQSHHLNAGNNAKIQKHIARSWQYGRAADDVEIPRIKCGGQQVGTVVVPKGRPAPREVITVITGDVVNIAGAGAC